VIQSVTIRRFKRFEELTFQLSGRHVVLAGPNNMGKTTILQAISAWALAFQRWKTLNDFQRHGGYYAKAPIARQAFSAVPLRTFDLLWTDRQYSGQLEIEIRADAGWSIPMEFIADIGFLKNSKARTELLPPALDAAGLPGFPYTRYYEIAALMQPEEIHPEVVAKLDGIMEAFGR
jgi:hypothetical protein